MWKTLEIKFEAFHYLVVVRHQPGRLPEWSVDPFHQVIYRETFAKWLKQNEKRLEKFAKVAIKKDSIEWECCYSERILMGRSRRSGSEVPGEIGGQVFTMVSPAWLILYLVAPNIIDSAKARVATKVAQQALSLLEAMTRIAYQGHSAASAPGGSNASAPNSAASALGGRDALALREVLTLRTMQGSAKVCGDGMLEMDLSLTAWRETFLEVEAKWHFSSQVHVKPSSLAGLLWICSRVLMLNQAGRTCISQRMRSEALSFVTEILEFLQNGLSKWAVGREEPNTAVLLSLQKELSEHGRNWGSQWKPAQMC